MPKPDHLAAPRRRVSYPLIGSIVAITGIAVLIISVFALRGNTDLQLISLFGGLIAFYMGLLQVGKHYFGPNFDLTAWLCVIWLVMLVSVALLAPLLPFGEHENLAKTIAEPALAPPDLLSANPLGTNNFGLDLLARTIYGARASLVVSIGAVLIGLVFGGWAGIVAGYFRGMTDSVVGILTNSLLAVPPLILLIALGTVLEPSLRNIAIALSLLALPSMIRMARASTLSFAQREFTLAAKSMGASHARIMLRELLPNVFLPLASYAMVIISVLIVAEASLSFLGLGVQAPSPSWGNMIAEGEGKIFERHPHVVLVPGAFLFLTVFSFNLLGEKARKRFDSKQSKL